MSKMPQHTSQSTHLLLKSDVLSHWINSNWIPAHPEQALLTLWVPLACISDQVLTLFDKQKSLANRFTFVGYRPTECAVTGQIDNYNNDGVLTYRTGAFLLQFKAIDADVTLELLMLSSYSNDCGDGVSLACIPQDFLDVWSAFSKECVRLDGSLTPKQEVVIIGGRASAFVPTADWEDIVLPARLKQDIMEDVESFFTKGVGVYQRLKLKPFRKLLLAGVPGTGKTMICSALAKWALAQEYVVIYISSGDEDRSAFWKIEQALSVAARSSSPALILLEELDAYLRETEKALVLNVLDGAEAHANEKGTLLITTTNYPEAIDERVLKRPGRLDRIYIIPETKHLEDAERMLHQYLGDMWRDEHSALAHELVGYPGAFIREVAIFALTQVAYEDLEYLSLEVLERSFDCLREQIDARDDFLKKRFQIGL